MRKYIAILGSGSTCQENLVAPIKRLGQLIAKHGWVTLTGGIGGIFDVVFDGANSANGDTIAVLNNQTEPYFGPCRLIVKAGSELTKRAIIAQTCDGGIIAGGWLGTVNIFSMILSQKKPVLAIRGWGGAADAFTDRYLIEPDVGYVEGVDDPEKAISRLHSIFSEKNV